MGDASANLDSATSSIFVKLTGASTPPEGDKDEASRIMQPFEGYWVFAFLPCKLRFLASADGPDSLSLAPPAPAPRLLTDKEKERLIANGGWGISLSAKTLNSIDAGNLIGYGLKEVDSCSGD